MSLATINTILNTAPVVIQGATRLVKLIRNQSEERRPETLDTTEGIKQEVERLHERLDKANTSDLEQIKLIKELARQNESLATQLKTTITFQNRAGMIAIIALVIAITCLLLLLA